MEWTTVGEKAEDRTTWRSMVEERVKHIAEWYSFQGKLSGVNQRPLRSTERKEEEDPLLCKWPGCGRRCKSKGGLAIHIRRMHDQEKAKMEFPCDFYGMIFKSMNTRINHCKSCGHLPPTNSNLRRYETQMGLHLRRGGRRS